HGLKQLTARHLDDGLRRAEDDLQQRVKSLAPRGCRSPKARNVWGWNNIPSTDEYYVVYAGLDAVYVRRLLPILLEVCGPYSHLVRMEQWLAAQSTGITIRGLALDIPYTQALLAEFEAEFERADQPIKEALRFSGNSPKFADWLSAQGVKGGPDDYTATGRLKVTADSLGALVKGIDSGEHEYPEIVASLVRSRLRMAETKNVISNLRQFLACADANGRLHPAINTLRAKTARMSITGPALQTLKKIDPRLRHCLKADDGCVLVACDFSQVEVRVAAALARDPRLVSVIESGVDIHDATATFMYGEKFTKAQRNVSKRATFGTIYGGGAKALSEQTGVTLNTARGVIDKWRRTYPNVIEYGKRLGRQKIVTTATGRRIPADPQRPYANSNYSIQSTARDLLVAAVYTLVTRYGMHAKLWLYVHDEVILQVPAAEAARVCKIVESVMTTTFRGVPIEAEAEILGTHWGRLPEQTEMAVAA
ncbi:DNA polymerase, partial [Nocardia grenadensis]